MKAFSVQSMLVALTGGLFVLTIGPALGDNQSGKAARPVPVRVTSGVEAVQGWEQGLVKGNPNLSHWHWDTIYSYKQSTGILRQRPLKPGSGPMSGTSGKPIKSTFNYPIERQHDIKPIHIPYSPEAMAEVQGKLFQPEKQQYPEYEPGHQESISGQLNNHPAEQPEISSYKHTYAQLGSPNTALKYNTQRTDVYGQLIDTHTSVKRINQTTIKSYKTTNLAKIRRNHMQTKIVTNAKSSSTARKGQAGHLGKLENQNKKQ